MTAITAQPGDIITVAPCPPAPAPRTLQQIIDGTASGGSVDVSGLLFKAGARITKPIRVYGTGWVVDGGIVAVAANGVTLDGLEVRNAVTTFQHGAIHAEGISGFTLLNAKAHHSGTGLSIISGTSHVVQNCLFWANDIEGFCAHGDFSQYPRMNGLWLSSVRSWGNGAKGDAGNEAGGMKLVSVDNSTLIEVDTDGNFGPGVWFDGKCSASRIVGGRHHDNTRSGLFIETNTSGSVWGVQVWECGWGNPDRTSWAGWGAGILLASSGNVVVAGNAVAWCPAGIGAISQVRPDGVSMTGTVSDSTNLVAVGSGVARSTYTEAGAPGGYAIALPTKATAAQIAAAGLPAAPQGGH